MSEELAPMIISCACGQKMKVPGNAAGKTYKCVKCGDHIQVPGDAPAATPPAGNLPPALEPVGQLLVEANCITAQQLDEALAEQKKNGGKTFEILLRLGYLDKARLHEVLSKQAGIATIDLARVTLDKELAGLVPREMALEHLVLPIDKLGKLLTVAMACPLDVATISGLEASTGLKVKAMLCRYDDIQTAVQKHYPDPNKPEGAIHTFQLPAGYDAPPKDDVTDKLGRLEELHYRADVLERAGMLAKDSAMSVGSLVETVTHDPALAAAVLRTANSSVYGMAGQVDGLALAVTLLGREGMSTLVQRCIKANVPPQKNLSPLYERALSTARNAALLARATGRVSRETAFTAGLLHGVGSFALEAAAAQRYGKLKTEDGGAALAAQEKQSLGIGHAEAGQTLLRRWRCPEALHAGVGQYLTDSAQKPNPVAALVGAAAVGTLEQGAEAAGAKPEAIARAVKEEDKLWESLRGLSF